MMDGTLLTGNKAPLRGRGITFGKTHICEGVGFEHFMPPNNQFPEGCIEMEFESNTFYEFTVYLDKKGVEVSIEGETISADFRPVQGGFDTVLGVAADRNPSSYGFFNVVQEI